MVDDIDFRTVEGFWIYMITLPSCWRVELEAVHTIRIITYIGILEYWTVSRFDDRIQSNICSLEVCLLRAEDRESCVEALTSPCHIIFHQRRHLLECKTSMVKHINASMLHFYTYTAYNLSTWLALWHQTTLYAESPRFSLSEKNTTIRHNFLTRTFASSSSA